MEATWENKDELFEAYPNFHLEDKVSLEGMGNDTQVPIANSSNNPIGPKEDKNPKLARERRVPVWAKDYELANARIGSGKLKRTEKMDKFPS